MPTPSFAAALPLPSAAPALFEAAFHDSPVACLMHRLSDGCIFHINRKFIAHFGWELHQVMHRTGLELNLWVNIADRDLWRQQLGSTGRVHHQESQWRTANGVLRHVILSGKVVEVNGEALVLAFVQDVTEHNQAQAQLDFLAHHDPLTGLPNRVLFRDRFEQAIGWAQHQRTRVALVYMDLDHFKTINDTLGHPVGDQLLQMAAQRLRHSLDEAHTVSRQGGDEFFVALTNVKDMEGVLSQLNRIASTMSQPFVSDQHSLTIGLSMGIALWPDDGRDFDTLMQRADTALFQAKAAGRNTWRFYTPGMNAAALEQFKLRTALHWALEQQQFVLHYQPQIDLTSGQVVGTEALLRWQRSPTELVGPGQFIATAEESGLIVPIGDWVLHQACTQAMRWQEQGLPPLTMAVNLSAVQFRRGNLLQSVTQALTLSGLDPALLELELTESLLIDDEFDVLETLRRIKALGVCLSIDDFGTGYSNLAYLKRFAVDKLKIDQSFVRDLASDPDDAAIVRAIIGMARSLKLRSIAEGVENADIAQALRLYHCDEVQGYHYARPMPAEAFAQWLHDYQSQVLPTWPSHPMLAAGRTAPA